MKSGMKMRMLLLAGMALGAALLKVSPAQAYGVGDIRINEILVVNENNYEDDYGHRVGWIELHNTGHSKVDVGGCYLTVQQKNDDRDSTWVAYVIPKGDPRTVIPPQGYLVFYAEGTATKGTFHTNFTLDRTGYLALYDQSGKGEPVDEVTYEVAAQQPDVSIGVMRNAEGEAVFMTLPATTPNATNEVEDPVPPHERFRRHDPSGVVMTVTAVAVVYTSLLSLWLIFALIGKLMVRLSNRKKEAPAAAKPAAEGKTPAVVPAGSEGASGISGEELAAIAMAVYRYQRDLHDIESTVLTINKVAKAYSPWSSKIYGLRQFPVKK